MAMKEKEIIEMIVAGYPWEQVIYKIVAVEAMDPWDMDIAALSSSLLKCLAKMKEMDFKIPAKYLIIAAVLLKMKSEHLQFIELLHENEAENEEDFEDEMDMFEMDNLEDGSEQDIKPNIDILSDAFNLREKRIHKRKVMFEELIESLKKAMKTEKRRERRRARGSSLKKLQVLSFSAILLFILQIPSGVSHAPEDITEKISPRPVWLGPIIM